VDVPSRCGLGLSARPRPSGTARLRSSFRRCPSVLGDRASACRRRAGGRRGRPAGGSVPSLDQLRRARSTRSRPRPNSSTRRPASLGRLPHTRAHRATHATKAPNPPIAPRKPPARADRRHRSSTYPRRLPRKILDAARSTPLVAGPSPASGFGGLSGPLTASRSRGTVQPEGALVAR